MPKVTGNLTFESMETMKIMTPSSDHEKVAPNIKVKVVKNNFIHLLFIYLFMYLFIFKKEHPQ